MRLSKCNDKPDKYTYLDGDKIAGTLHKIVGCLSHFCIHTVWMEIVLLILYKLLEKWPQKRLNLQRVGFLFILGGKGGRGGAAKSSFFVRKWCAKVVTVELNHEMTEQCKTHIDKSKKVRISFHFQNQYLLIVCDKMFAWEFHTIGLRKFFFLLISLCSLCPISMLAVLLETAEAPNKSRKSKWKNKNKYSAK